MWSGQWPGPEPVGSGRAWASNMTIVLRAGPGHTFAGRAGPGPHNSVCGPGPGQVCTTAAGPGRAWASNNICGPGLGLNFRPVQGPTAYLCRPIQPTCRDSRLRQPSDRELHRPVPNKAIGSAEQEL